MPEVALSGLSSEEEPLFEEIVVVTCSARLDPNELWLSPGNPPQMVSEVG